MDTPTSSHSIDRTSPMGQSFVGRCNQCGAEGLTFKNMDDECANPTGVTQEESILRAILGEDNE